MDKQEFVSTLEREWTTDSRWDGITGPYTAGDVYRLRGSIDIEYSLARYGAARLWQLFQDEPYVAVLSASTGNQAIQEVQAGLKAVYVSGWQVAADANNALEMYPDQSLYPSDSVPTLLRRINNALKRADEIAHLKGDQSVYWFAPLVADAEADRPFVTGERTPEGFFRVSDGVEAAIARALAYAPYADLLWFETSKPDLKEATRFANAIHERFPGKLLAYNCSPSFNWRKQLSEAQIGSFQKELGALGYKFQFVTLSAFHALNHAMFELAREYRDKGMVAYAELQGREFASERDGYAAVRHQEFVGVGYFDEVTQIATGGVSSVTAMEGSTEQQQVREPEPRPAAARRSRRR